LAPDVVEVARQLGYVLLPWQRLVLDAALEVQRGKLLYRDVMISVPRQSGKTTLSLTLIVWKLLNSPDATVLFGAQTRLVARERLIWSWWSRISASPLADRFTLYRGYGAEALACDNGAVLRLLASSEHSGHGESLSLAVIDECWSLDQRVEQATRPAMMTRRDAQTWMLSTAGTASSVWWKSKVDAARLSSTVGVGPAYFEWSAAPEANPADESTWWQAMPALGRLADIEVIRHDLAAMSVDEFKRAYLNMWPDPASEGWKVFDEAKWMAARDD
jgi:phage terminase large subunit-like protein